MDTLCDMLCETLGGLSLVAHLLHQDLSQAAIVHIGTALHLHQELLQHALWVAAEGHGVLAGTQVPATGSTWLLADAEQALCPRLRIPRLGKVDACQPSSCWQSMLPCHIRTLSTSWGSVHEE